jgi:predicted AAA+ superfamily ATPase|nr:AAA family ATPase [Solobacterium sp.]MCH4222606.1 AAA family ATPase [Solobacterium sp.]MCH4266702.1 AAA family ATPase [Solobacterium sp.]
MSKRKMMNTLIDWHASRKQKCLLIKGARKVGKTDIVRTFGKEHYKSFIEINFEAHPEFKDIFSASLSVSDLQKEMSLRIPDIHFIPNDTLILLDEIEFCPQARTSLKFWAEDDRFDVIATGSLLGLNHKEVSSYPVGYEQQIEMHPLDFEEFLWAIGIQDTDSIKEYFDRKQQLPDALHETLMKYLREYMAVGGMPEVVNTFIKTGNYNEIQSVQEQIVTAYLDDISKYADQTDKPKARNCYLSIPKQLARESRKFKYSLVSHGGRSSQYTNSLDWLKDAGLIHFCTNVSTPQFPLPAYANDEQFKVYLDDIGLLISMYGYQIKQAIIEDTLTGAAKGGIYHSRQSTTTEPCISCG